jgi:hypothetical protein
MGILCRISKDEKRVEEISDIDVPTLIARYKLRFPMVMTSLTVAALTDRQHPLPSAGRPGNDDSVVLDLHLPPIMKHVSRMPRKNAGELNKIGTYK